MFGKREGGRLDEGGSVRRRRRVREEGETQRWGWIGGWGVETTLIIAEH